LISISSLFWSSELEFELELELFTSLIVDNRIDDSIDMSFTRYLSDFRYFPFTKTNYF